MVSLHGADMVQRLGDGDPFRHRDELGRHQPARAVGRPGQQPAQRLADRRQQRQHRLRIARGQVGEQVGGAILGHGGDQRRALGKGQGGERPRRAMIFGLLQHAHRIGGVERAQHRGGGLGRLAAQMLGDIGRIGGGAVRRLEKGNAGPRAGDGIVRHRLNLATARSAGGRAGRSLAGDHQGACGSTGTVAGHVLASETEGPSLRSRPLVPLHGPVNRQGRTDQ